ncbi:hypothetical protein BB560_000751 [Smittium megazygosporum]|uniref:Uncharacterized protein n=1 Tax=Smittium megazygosporum TaxID=133381 RepID=A0A2T9ZJG4_9FUNG|nr:hypothetical protein BB560_000751 [Smittium megazygosporum]
MPSLIRSPTAFLLKSKPTTQISDISFLPQFSKLDNLFSGDQSKLASDDSTTSELDSSEDHLEQARTDLAETFNIPSVLEYNELLENRLKLGLFDLDSYEVYLMTLNPEFSDQDAETVYDEPTQTRRLSSSSLTTLIESFPSQTPSYPLLPDPHNICWSKRRGYSADGNFLEKILPPFAKRAKLRYQSSRFRVYSLERRMILNSKILYPLKNRHVELNPRFN